MSNNEKFNALLNSSADPGQIYKALLALAETGFSGEQLKEVAAEATARSSKCEGYPPTQEVGGVDT